LITFNITKLNTSSILNCSACRQDKREMRPTSSTCRQPRPTSRDLRHRRSGPRGGRAFAHLLGQVQLARHGHLPPRRRHARAAGQRVQC